MDINDLDNFDDDLMLDEQHDQDQMHLDDNRDDNLRDQDNDLQRSDDQQQDDDLNALQQHDDYNEEDLITQMLKERNIEDPTKIKFEDENGNIQERDWKTLSREEQLNILDQSMKDYSDYDLEDDEKGLINHIRLNNMTPDEYINYVKQLGAQEYASQLQQNPQYKVDDLSDDELYILDLQSRIPDITDDEAKAMLDRAKEDSSLFEKQMGGIREEYKKLEDDKNTREQLEQQEQASEAFQKFQDSVIDEIQSFNKVGGLDIQMDDDDMNEVANFILSTDNAGVNYLAKALEDPQTLVRMAWFALKGDEAIDNITQYFTDKIKEVSQQRYNQGLQDAKSGKQPNVVITKGKPYKQKGQKEISIFDLD